MPCDLTLTSSGSTSGTRCNVRERCMRVSNFSLSLETSPLLITSSGLFASLGFDMCVQGTCCIRCLIGEECRASVFICAPSALLVSNPNGLGCEEGEGMLRMTITDTLPLTSSSGLSAVFLDRPAGRSSPYWAYCVFLLTLPPPPPACDPLWPGAGESPRELIALPSTLVSALHSVDLCPLRPQR